MSTDLLREYLKHRDQGHGHWAACIALARRFDLDKHTVDRVIARAERAHAHTHPIGASLMAPKPTHAAAKPKASPKSAKPPTAPAKSTGGLPQNRRAGAQKR